MTLFRLLPRLLLCSLAGLLTFAASNWLLRPRPNWTIHLGDHESPDFTDGETNPSANEPIWVTLSHANGPVFDSIAAFHPSDGRLLKRLDKRDDAQDGGNSLNAMRMADGRLLTVAYKDYPKGHPKTKAGVAFYNEFAFNDAFSSGPPITTSIDDFWHVTDDARRAWTVDETKTGFRIAVADVATGARRHALDCSREYPHFSREHFKISPDARWVVVRETCRDPNRKPAGLDVWDVEKGVLARTIYPPEWPPENARHRLWHGDFIGPDRLSYFIPTKDNGRDGQQSTEASFDLKHGRHLDARWEPEPPGPNLALSVHREAGGEHHWTAFDATRGTAWHALFNDDRQLTKWRPVRVPFVTHADSMWTSHAFGVNRYGTIESGLAVWRVPGHPAFVAHALQPAIQDGLPGSLLEWVPEKWKSDSRPLRSHWNDGDHGPWLDVGLGGEALDLQLRSNALLAIMTLPDGARILQSWPLPPRDPRLPAALIAFVSPAALWFLLSRRARRKTLAAQQIASPS